MDKFAISSIIGNDASSSWIVFALSAFMGFSISYVASNTASAVISCPLAATLAIGVGLNPIPHILAAGLASSISSGLPSTTPQWQWYILQRLLESLICLKQASYLI